MDTPAIDRLSKVSHKTQAIHDFLEWLDYNEGISLGKYLGADLFPISTHERDNLMAEFYGVDLKAVEAEKQAILEEIRKKHEDAKS